MMAVALRPRAAWSARLFTAAKLGVRMMLHDKLKLAGTLFGVVFAVVLSNQQIGIFLGLVSKNVMFVEHAGADLWVVPASTETLQPGKPLSLASLHSARVTPGVAWAEPLLYGGTLVSLPSGGSEPVTLIGTRAPNYRGGPWNMVTGAPSVLAQPNAMIFEDSEREKLGGLDLHSVREVGGYRTTVAGFTWGLLPFAPSYAFAEYDYARLLMHQESDQTSFVLVGLAPGADLAAVQQRLSAELPQARVLTRGEFRAKIVSYLLRSTGMGATFGTSTAFGLIIGLVIVALSMFSAVIDNVREFGTLKALGQSNFDLALLLLTQSCVYAVFGTLFGLSLVSQIARGIRSPKLALVLPWQLYAGTLLVMIVLCALASLLALTRLRKVEPAMVFR